MPSPLILNSPPSLPPCPWSPICIPPVIHCILLSHDAPDPLVVSENDPCDLAIGILAPERTERGYKSSSSITSQLPSLLCFDSPGLRPSGTTLLSPPNMCGERVCATVTQLMGSGGLDDGGETIVGHGPPGSPNRFCPLDDLGRNLYQSVHVL